MQIQWTFTSFFMFYFFLLTAKRDVLALFILCISYSSLEYDIILALVSSILLPLDDRKLTAIILNNNIIMKRRKIINDVYTVIIMEEQKKKD